MLSLMIIFVIVAAGCIVNLIWQEVDFYRQRKMAAIYRASELGRNWSLLSEFCPSTGGFSGMAT